MILTLWFIHKFHFLCRIWSGEWTLVPQEHFSSCTLLWDDETGLRCLVPQCFSEAAGIAQASYQSSHCKGKCQLKIICKSMSMCGTCRPHTWPAILSSKVQPAKHFFLWFTSRKLLLAEATFYTCSHHQLKQTNKAVKTDDASSSACEQLGQDHIPPPHGVPSNRLLHSFSPDKESKHEMVPMMLKSS